MFSATPCNIRNRTILPNPECHTPSRFLPHLKSVSSATNNYKLFDILANPFNTTILCSQLPIIPKIQPISFIYKSSTSLIPTPNMPFDSTALSSFNFSAVSMPPAGTLYSNLFPGVGVFPPGSWYGKGNHCGRRPNCTRTVAWSHAMCSW